MATSCCSKQANVSNAFVNEVNRGITMAHNTVKTGFAALTERINLYPQGATESELLNKILQILFKENEAGLVAALPIKPFTSRRAATIWQMPEARARNILENLADKGLLVDMAHGKNTLYALPPPMAGFFEFSLMRVRPDVDLEWERRNGELI
jgi:hypothetical protein